MHMRILLLKEITFHSSAPKLTTSVILPITTRFQVIPTPNHLLALADTGSA